MKMALEFIDFYNKIDKHLIKTEDFEIDETFSQKIKNSKNPVVKTYKEELISLGQLRNAIQHNPYIHKEPIADPHPQTVDRIKELYKEISNPQKVYPLFKRDVFKTRENDYVDKIIIQMREKCFSQVPILNEDNKLIDIINTNTISRWLAKNIDKNGEILIDQRMIKDLLQEIEIKNNYQIFPRSASIYDAYETFFEAIQKNGISLDAIFITETGKASEKILGIITLEDVILKFRELGLQ